MYKRLLIITALSFITACAGISKDDDLIQNAEESYKSAKLVIDEAKSYGLNVSHADKKLSQSEKFKNEEKYTESITASILSTKLATSAINEHKTLQAQYLATTRAQQEKSHAVSTVAERLDKTEKTYVVQPGDNLWNIAASSSELSNDALLWPLLLSDNKSIVDDADLIHPNTILRIKTAGNQNLIDKARRHARTRGIWSIASIEKSDLSYLNE